MRSMIGTPSTVGTRKCGLRPADRSLAYWSRVSTRVSQSASHAAVGRSSSSRLLPKLRTCATMAATAAFCSLTARILTSRAALGGTAFATTAACMVAQALSAVSLTGGLSISSGRSWFAYDQRPAQKMLKAPTVHAATAITHTAGPFFPPDADRAPRLSGRTEDRWVTVASCRHCQAPRVGPQPPAPGVRPAQLHKALEGRSIERMCPLTWSGWPDSNRRAGLLPGHTPDVLSAATLIIPRLFRILSPRLRHTSVSSSPSCTGGATVTPPPGGRCSQFERGNMRSTAVTSAARRAAMEGSTAWSAAAAAISG
ncbi:hypothetical protein GA0070618_2394 [Micromonospora echinospora]|uniref:Uncharacterized protein n=1 Tax=Micromonospora echinospora TaxID=1877 RepID=A0A1C4WPP9_MICEC|nr:hypothetical protein GA0070618_2394 [Micromonospora echinospora]